MLGDVKKMLALITVCFFFAVILVLFFVQIPAANLDLLKIVVMALLSGASMVLGYYFGSSEGSAKKNEILDRVANPPAVVDVPPAPGPGSEAGFARLRLLSLMALGAIYVAMLYACATTGKHETPQSIAAKSAPLVAPGRDSCRHHGRYIVQPGSHQAGRLQPHLRDVPPGPGGLCHGLRRFSPGRPGRHRRKLARL